jgi:hypothetical protein
MQQYSFITTFEIIDGNDAWNKADKYYSILLNSKEIIVNKCNYHHQANQTV